MLGRPKICEPVLIRIWPGAWLNASVDIHLTMAMSSTTSARCGSSSESSVPDWPCLANLNFGPEQLGVGVDERRAIALEQLGRGQRAVELGELRLVVEQLQVARPARHEQEDHPLGLGREVRRLGRQRIDALAARRRGARSPPRRAVAPGPSSPGRRRTARGTSGARRAGDRRRRYRWSWQFMVRAPGSAAHSLVIVSSRFEQHAGDDGPAGKLGGRRASAGSRSASSGLSTARSQGFDRPVGEPLRLACEQGRAAAPVSSASGSRARQRRKA